ncbi:uncharacterized protein Z518_03677 [Rhinocladiella mackenziei CBS 650.93]|uniref:Rhinocladiella mackenziei CBS 650.93 unplaced genomic scaffold supercont1.3, whole genome shotgun sequence n=1 Tax=Rhinocladiella mackenziei CBS 650.93 TaxID=1442369 RepID=A0A0D2J9A5_9EURO|nr:uncharacterized protein Z518_03677 [Rhinocladiella mackenziei CBS 650.93]KIX05705.1 hypothetical protein Z518_03677 [Rhinocladiella mackenziei CBS 650.93]
MGEPFAEGSQPSIFIIGAQCTGKTTLVDAICTKFRAEDPNLHFTPVKELARGILVSTNVNRDDIRAGSGKAMEFQRLVLKAQLEAELELRSHGLIISDRSGIDPIAYAAKYGPPEVVEGLLGTPEWKALRERMLQGIVVLCEPVPAWLFDDGVRLMPNDNTEWLELHAIFISLLQQCDIPFEILSGTTTDIGERVEFVVGRWRRKNATMCTLVDGARLGTNDGDIDPHT